MSIQDALLSSIETMIQNTAADYMPQSDYACVVKAIKNNKYEVSINGGTYHVYNGVGVNIKVGSAVWVHVPNQNFGQAFIVGVRGTSASPGGGTTAEVMRGATDTSDGTSGLVPVPPAGANTKFLRGDATWANSTGTTEIYTSTMPTSADTGTIVLLKY